MFGFIHTGSKLDLKEIFDGSPWRPSLFGKSHLPKARQTDLKVVFVDRNFSEFEFFYGILGFRRGRPPPLCLSQPIRLQKLWGLLRKGICFSPYFRLTKGFRYSSVPGHRNHRNHLASTGIFLSTQGWNQHPACQRWLFLLVSCIYKPPRNCPPSQRVSKLQCKKSAKKNISMLRFYVGFFERFCVDL